MALLTLVKRPVLALRPIFISNFLRGLRLGATSGHLTEGGFSYSGTRIGHAFSPKALAWRTRPERWSTRLGRKTNR